MRSIETSPQLYARLGGALYLVIILFGAFSEGFVTNKLLVAGDAAASARNILAAPGLWQVGVAANVLVVGCAVPLLWIEYLLLRPVSRPLALLSLLFNGVSLAVEAVSKVFLLLVLPTLATAGYGHAFGAAQVATITAAGDVLKKSGVIEPGTDVAQTVKDLIDNSFAGKLPTAKAATALK